MNREGPPIESLTRRLAETPAEFLAEPRLGKSGEVHVAAVIADLPIDLEPLPPGGDKLVQYTTDLVDRGA